MWEASASLELLPFPALDSTAHTHTHGDRCSWLSAASLQCTTPAWERPRSSHGVKDAFTGKTPQVRPRTCITGKFPARSPPPLVHPLWENIAALFTLVWCPHHSLDADQCTQGEGLSAEFLHGQAEELEICWFATPATTTWVVFNIGQQPNNIRTV